MNDLDEHRFFQDQIKREKAARFAGQRLTTGLKRFEADVTDRLVNRLAGLGFTDIHATVDQAPFDLWVGNARVEVKASRWQNWKNRGRYQACMRNHRADVVLFVTVNGTDYDFVIPQDAIGTRKTLEITSYDVNAYDGQWKPFLEAYSQLLEAIRQAPERERQLSLWQ